MGIRQSKRSVDISGSPKKEVPAAVVEKIPQNNDATSSNVEKKDEEIATTINGETKAPSEPVELVKSRLANSLSHQVVCLMEWFVY